MYEHLIFINQNDISKHENVNFVPKTSWMRMPCMEIFAYTFHVFKRQIFSPFHLNIVWILSKNVQSLDSHGYTSAIVIIGLPAFSYSYMGLLSICMEMSFLCKEISLCRHGNDIFIHDIFIPRFLPMNETFQTGWWPNYAFILKPINIAFCNTFISIALTPRLWGRTEVTVCICVLLLGSIKCYLPSKRYF